MANSMSNSMIAARLNIIILHQYQLGAEESARPVSRWLCREGRPSLVVKHSACPSSSQDRDSGGWLVHGPLVRACRSSLIRPLFAQLASNDDRSAYVIWPDSAMSVSVDLPPILLIFGGVGFRIWGMPVARVSPRVGGFQVCSGPAGPGVVRGRWSSSSKGRCVGRGAGCGAAANGGRR